MRFPRVFGHFFSVVFVRSRCCVDFACVAILLFSGPKLEVLLFLARFMLEGPFRLHFDGILLVSLSFRRLSSFRAAFRRASMCQP